MSDHDHIAIVLGGTRPHVALIRRLKEKGYYVILVDYLENPIAKSVADEHIRESTLDKEFVLEIAKNRGAGLVISVAIDQANVTACYVGEQLGLPIPYDYQTSLRVTDKTLMKQVLIVAGIPTARYAIVDGMQETLPSDLRFPVVVKPADSNSSKAVRTARDLHELSAAVDIATRASRNAAAIVEEHMEGREVGIDCIIGQSDIHIVMTKSRRKIRSIEPDQHQIFGCMWPIRLSEPLLDQVKEAARNIARAFGLRNGPLMIQGIVVEERFYVIEFGARIGGGESDRIIRLATGLDMIEVGINSFLGRPICEDFRAPRELFADNFLYVSPDTFGSITGYEDLLEDGTIEYMDWYKPAGTRIGVELSSNNRVGVFTVKGRNEDEIRVKIDKVINAIDVISDHGESILRRELYHDGVSDSLSSVQS